MKRVVAIVGPTAVGKSDLALSLAQAFEGEIVNADSRQAYRWMDIGTAKPSLEERASVPHHLIDIIEPTETFSLATFQPLAYEAIEDIIQRGRLPLLVGGSGLYVWSILEGWQIPQVPPDQTLRHRLEEEAAASGAYSLYQRLLEIDPASAKRIDPRNVRRVIRALEVYEATNIPFSQLQKKEAPPFDVLVLGLTSQRSKLYNRIDNRVEKMIKQGLVEEVKVLVKRGYGFHLPAMSSVGYRQIGRLIRGEIDLATAVQQIKFETHRFARHQYAWFRLKDPRIRWLDTEGDIETKASRLIREEMKE